MRTARHVPLLSFVLLACLITAARGQVASNIVIMTVEDPSNYDAVNSMRSFADQELRPQGHRVTIVEGDNPLPHHFDGLTEALPKADLLVLFVRRRFPPKAQLDAVRAHLDAGKPLLGIRTANHAFIPRPNELIQDATLATWPEFTSEVLGGQNTGYETKGIPYVVSVLPGAADNPLLSGVQAEKINGHGSLYKVLPLAADAKPLLLGTAQGQQPAQPIAWTRLYGKNKSRIFYTSLGAPEDMKQADVRRLLLNAVRWTLDVEPGRKNAQARDDAAAPFAGLSLEGWTTSTGGPVTKGWQAAGGEIWLDRQSGRGGNIITKEDFGDFDLAFEWKIAPGGNSGLKYRVRDYGGKVLGCEYQICDDQAGRSGERRSAGALYDLYEPSTEALPKPAGEWNHARIVVRDQTIEHWLNGRLIVAATIGDEIWKQRVAESKFSNVPGFGQNHIGRMMLTDHGSDVSYRNFVLKPLAGTR